MHKLLNSVLAFVFAIILSSCGEGKLQSEKEQREGAALDAAVKLCNDLRSASLGDFEEYFLPDSDCRELYNLISDIKPYADSFVKQLDVKDAEKAEELSASVSERFYKSLDYTVDYVKSDEEEVEVGITAVYPHIDAKTAMEKIDTTSLMTEAFGVDITDSDAFNTMLKERKGIEKGDLSIDSAEFKEQVCDIFSDELDVYYGLVIDNIFDTPDVRLINLEFSVRDIDGEWKITDIDNL